MSYITMKGPIGSITQCFTTRLVDVHTEQGVFSLKIDQPGRETLCERVKWSFRCDCDGSPQCPPLLSTVTALLSVYHC